MEQEESRLIAALKELDLLLSLDFWQKPSTKSAFESMKARQEGNALYKKPKHDEAAHREILRLYTKSLAYAPPDSEYLALAYGNRSALLYHFGKYREAIGDLDLALALPLPDHHVVKYLCRKVECQVELGLIEANDTCEVTKAILQDLCVRDDVKKDIVLKLVKAIIKLEKHQFKIPEVKRKLELLKADQFASEKPSECPNASNAVAISRSNRYFRFGRHLTANCDIAPGVVLYVGEPYVSFPMQAQVHTHCAHCLRFAWAGLPCDDCVCTIYCSDTCRRIAWKLYHDVECKIIRRGWKVQERMNSARLMSVRMLIMAVRESGSLEKLKQAFEEIDDCKDQRKKGFSNDHTMFINNYRTAYSLLTHINKKTNEELVSISRDSAVLLYLIARYTTFFRNYFDYDKKALMVSDDALFVGKLISRYQHLILINAVTVKDMYIASSKDWNWITPKEENCTGLHLTPFLSLLNHSCYPNTAKCETIDRKIVLFSIRPISKGEQIFDCYGPTYSELIKTKRQQLLNRFYFICDCIACENNWPLFMNTLNTGIKFSASLYSEINATTKAHKKCEKILQSLENGNGNINLDNIQELAYAIIITIKYCKLPNWRLPTLTATLIAVFNELYGYIIKTPITC